MNRAALKFPCSFFSFPFLREKNIVCRVTILYRGLSSNLLKLSSLRISTGVLALYCTMSLGIIAGAIRKVTFASA